MVKYKYQFFTIMLVLCIGYTVSQFLRTSVGVLSPSLMEDFNISPNNMGLLGGVFFLSFALFQLPAGVLIDRYGPRIIMTLMIINIIVTTNIIMVIMIPTLF